MAGMRATKKALEFVREMDLPRFRGCDEVRVADFTVEEAAMYEDFLRRDLKKRSKEAYENAKALGKTLYKARSSLSSEQHERRKMLGSKNSHLIYAKKKALAAYGRSRGITMLLNTGLQEMRDTLNRHGVEDETIQEIEAQAVVTSKRKDPDEDGVLRPGPSKKPKPESEEDEEDEEDEKVADVSSLNRKQLGKKALRDFLRANPHIQPPPKTAKALRDAWPEDAKRYRTYVRSLQPDKYKAMEERNNAKRKGKRGEYNKQRRENNHERVLEIERRYNASDKGKLSRYIRDCKTWAQEKGIPYELTDERVKDMREQACHYCGDQADGIDCVDVNAGFVEDNCVPCCTICNQAKKEYHVQDFLRMMCNIGSVHNEDIDAGWVRSYDFVVEPKVKSSGDFDKYERNAEALGRDFCLTRQQFEYIVSNPCHYCLFKHPDPSVKVGVDRVDSKRRYILDNVVACCVHCNFMKRHRAPETFVAKAKMILQKQVM